MLCTDLLVVLGEFHACGLMGLNLICFDFI